ncbi:lysine--tRNA ligase [Patescibacteria group bacterium]|nr:lysine--tRNA ligase [Patescibacteria group bacterium]
MGSPEEKLIKERKDKLTEWIDKVENPYWARFCPRDCIQGVKNNFGRIKAGEKTQDKVILGGRIMGQRGHGKAAFLDLKDATGKIQLYARSDTLREKYPLLSKIDIGDIVGVEGKVFKTRTGELTVDVYNILLLSKSLHPLPEKWHGLQDIEIRYRKRWLDLLVNPRVREIFLKRKTIIQAIRDFLDRIGFLEVETPLMQPVPGGATARPFKTYHNALGKNFYLRIAPELYLKKLVVGGLEKVYELNKNFRNEGIDRFHNPEFTMLEVYSAYDTYQEMMELTQKLVCEVAGKVKDTLKFPYQGKEIDLSLPWKRISFQEVLREVGGIEINFKDEKQVKKIALKEGLAVEELTNAQILEHLLDKKVVPKLIQPTFVFDYPEETAPLAKRKKDDFSLVERFEIFMGGQELGNAYSELNDPIEQRKRLVSSSKKEFLDEDFLEALEYGMPPTAGLGIGIDRLVMLLTDSASIRDVILFPQMRPKSIIEE